ncbi:MAG: glycoside hydrolase family 172 protein [Mucilaginibacter sp.]
MRSIKNISFSVMLCLPCLFGYAQGRVDMRSLLREIVDYNAMARWPAPAYHEIQASSYDRKSLAPGQSGWFANGDASQYIRMEKNGGRTEHVMMEADGPGAIVRFWLTTFKRNGTLRIYFDNQAEPTVTIPAYDLMRNGLGIGQPLLQPHSSYEPKEKGGSTLYLPMPFAKHCKITFEDKDTDNQPRYYQINYRVYNEDAKVKTFSVDQVASAKSLIDSVNEKLRHPGMPSGQKISLSKTIGTEKPLALNLPAGTHAVKQIAIQLKDISTQADKLMVAIKFDGRRTVYCPLGDFMGSGKGGKPIESWYRSVTKDGNIDLRWVMPYRKSASITLVNTSSEDIPVTLTAVTENWKWDSHSLYFHADWKEGHDIPVRKEEKDNPIEWNFNTIKGRGMFMGDTFAVDNLMHTWYGEGDQKYWVDGNIFPSEYGTGTEDYYNTSWAPVVLYQTPFANAPRADNSDSFGANTFTRTRNLDRVPFHNNFKYDLEMLGWQNGEINASAVTYWYGDIAQKTKTNSTRKLKQ